jgi:mRNA-degrading endonuclease RelE of RelBE toxin-antitoxin system
LNSFRIDVSFATFISEFKAATKKFKTFKADLIRAFEEIEKNPRAGDQIPRTGSDLFKIRLGVKGQIGKRGGYRLIYHVDWSRQVITPIALYFKPDVPNLPDAADALLRAGYRGVVLKLGPLGCYVAAGGARAAVPAFEVAAVDTTAAGDTFNGAFAVSLAEGAGIEEAALFANAAAAISVTRPGAQNSVPARAEVEQLLAARRKVACSR